MSLSAEYLAVISLLSLIPYSLKGLTGFGPALLFVPLASALFGQPLAVAASGALDVTSGAALTATDPQIRRGHEGFFIGSAMALGTAAGVVALSRIPSTVSAGVLVAAVVIGLISVVDAQRKGPVETSRKIGPRGGLVGLLAGAIGGITGINGPPLVIYLQRVLSPHDQRIVLTRVLLVSAVVRVITFFFVGNHIAEAMILTLVCLPTQLVGLLIGSRFAKKTSPRRLAGINSSIVAISIILAAYNAFAGTGG
ncbi:sulfite exporter TauE/SafE family protein [Streptomyces triticisoli]|jgi:uncharacterized membrane protein YfcA|uniref:sulfite exporter TauE/SafE family protein n=1 Tax=Streptomyces triticisoli TaxID=2182797 RepID=UPI000DD6D018|nr:sulfite exporter TauE/SafE family protein [Streptomyces triticisoli]